MTARLAQDCQVLRVSQNHSISDHVSLGCPISVRSLLFFFTNLFSDATFRIIYTSDWNQKKPLCHSAVEWTAWPSGQTDPRHTTVAQTTENSDESPNTVEHAAHSPESPTAALASATSEW